jgi:mannosyltransferase OCH1-like enzyme
MSIPRNIFQTHESVAYLNTKPRLVEAMQSWAEYSSDFQYFFYDSDMRDAFMRDCGPRIYTAFQMLPLPVMKADLWRYCVIYKYGGIYCDADTVCKAHPNYLVNNSSWLAVAPEPDTGFFCQWAFAAPAGSPILKTIINLSVDRIISTPIEGEHIIHYLTGPSAFTTGIELFLSSNNLPLFEDKREYVNYPHPVLQVFDPLSFHGPVVAHLFAGSDDDGWKQQVQDSLINHV